MGSLGKESHLMILPGWLAMTPRGPIGHIFH
jgi:hypothetical protein